VSIAAPFCPSCGQPKPAEDATGCVIVVVLLALLHAPSIIVIMIFGGLGFVDSLAASVNSWWGWLGSLAFWVVCISLYFGNKNKS
jgi:uncharacterized protein involved in cysteine biosynthesis